VKIRSCDDWFKIVEFLQQNWVLVDNDPVEEGCIILFFGDTFGGFDRLRLSSRQEAAAAQMRNGSRLCETDDRANEFITQPDPPP